jgi:hypothetical protein
MALRRLRFLALMKDISGVPERTSRFGVSIRSKEPDPSSENQATHLAIGIFMRTTYSSD